MVLVLAIKIIVPLINGLGLSVYNVRFAHLVGLNGYRAGLSHYTHASRMSSKFYMVGLPQAFASQRFQEGKIKLDCNVGSQSLNLPGTMITVNLVKSVFNFHFLLLFQVPSMKPTLSDRKTSL